MVDPAAEIPTVGGNGIEAGASDREVARRFRATWMSANRRSSPARVYSTPRPTTGAALWRGPPKEAVIVMAEVEEHLVKIACGGR